MTCRFPYVTIMIFWMKSACPSYGYVVSYFHRILLFLALRTETIIHERVGHGHVHFRAPALTSCAFNSNKPDTINQVATITTALFDIKFFRELRDNQFAYEYTR